MWRRGSWRMARQQEWHAGGAQDALCHTAQQQMMEITAPVGRHDNGVALLESDGVVLDSV